MSLTEHQSSLLARQIFGTMRVIQAFEAGHRYQWREGEIPGSANFRVQGIRLALQVSREQFEARFRLPAGLLQALEEFHINWPEGTGVLFLRYLAERTNQRAVLV